MSNQSTGRQVDRFPSAVPENHGDSLASILQLCIHSLDIETDREFSFVLWIGWLDYDIEPVVCKECFLGSRHNDLRGESWYCDSIF